jgi:hypothetical protein
MIQSKPNFPGPPSSAPKSICANRQRNSRPAASRACASAIQANKLAATFREGVIALISYQLLIPG